MIKKMLSLNVTGKSLVVKSHPSLSDFVLYDGDTHLATANRMREIYAMAMSAGAKDVVYVPSSKEAVLFDPWIG